MLFANVNTCPSRTLSLDRPHAHPPAFAAAAMAASSAVRCGAATVCRVTRDAVENHHPNCTALTVPVPT